jgi:tol-pal system protein YbgF
MPILSRPAAALILGSFVAGASSLACHAGAPRASADLLTQSLRLQNIELAQYYPVPPGEVGGEAPYGRPQSDPANLLIRIDRLESQLRQINGEIERLQFELRKLSEQLGKFQEDVDFRFRENSGERAPPSRPQKRTEVPGQLPESGDLAAEARPGPRQGRRGDAFDPALDPSAPGAPRVLGNGSRAAPPADPLADLAADDPNRPLDLLQGRQRGRQSVTPAPAAPQSAQAALQQGTAAAARSLSSEEFDLGLSYLKQKEFENAEKSFATYLQKNPNAKMTPEAIYYLGETYYQRGRQREAAEQYLKVSTQYASSPRAPEALLRLGQSLSALGAKEQACAAFAEIARKYPNAAPQIKAAAERQVKRSQC